MSPKVPYVFYLLVAWFSLASAQGNPSKEDCTRTALTELEMERCAARSLEAADESLNRTYRSVISELSPAQSRGLRAAQRAWVTYRDLDCASVRTGYGTGTGATLAGLNCLVRHTEDRTAQLRDLYGLP